MPTTAKTKTSTVLLISSEKSHGYLYINLDAAQRNEEGNIRNFSSSHRWDESGGFSGLRIQATLSREFPQVEWEVGYQTHTGFTNGMVMATRAKLMRRVQRATDACHYSGQVFDQRLILEAIAKELKVSEFLWNPTPYPGGNHDEQPYKSGGLAFAFDTVTEIVNAYKD